MKLKKNIINLKNLSKKKIAIKRMSIKSKRKKMNEGEIEKKSNSKLS